jgi:hypothetical protein
VEVAKAGKRIANPNPLDPGQSLLHQAIGALEGREELSDEVDTGAEPPRLRP